MRTADEQAPAAEGSLSSGADALDDGCRDETFERDSLDPDVVAVVERMGQMLGLARQPAAIGLTGGDGIIGIEVRWGGRWQPLESHLDGLERLRTAAPNGRRGERAARATGRRACILISERKVPGRRGLIEALMLVEEGRDALVVDGRRRSRRDDPVYRRARARVVRRLERARGMFPELESFLRA